MWFDNGCDVILMCIDAIDDIQFMYKCIKSMTLCFTFFARIIFIFMYYVLLADLCFMN